MSTFAVLTVGVCLVCGLRAADGSAKQQAARLAMQRHDYSAAAQLFHECVALSGSSGERVTALASYGIALNRAGRNAEAKTALEQALAEWKDSTAEGEAVASGSLAAADRGLGDYQEAEQVLRAAIGRPSTSRGNRVMLTVDLADLLREEARGSEARTLLDDALQRDDLRQDERVNVLMETAELDLDLRLSAESRELWNEIGEIGGTEDPLLEAAVEGGLGESWMAEGNPARAEPLLRRSLQLYRNYPGSSPLQIATALASMARLYLDEDKLALADEALSEAIAKDEASLGAGHPQIAALRVLRANILSRHGDAQEARDELEQAETILANHFGPGSLAVAVVYAELGDVELNAKRIDAAVEQYGNALRLFRESGAERSGPGVAVAARYSAALKAAKRSETARSMTEAAGSQSFRQK